MNRRPATGTFCAILLAGLLLGVAAGPAMAQAVLPVDDFGLTASEGKAVPVELRWKAPVLADFFKVLRDGQPIAETAVAFYPDAPSSPEVTYQIEAWRGGKKVGESASVTFKVPDRPIHFKTALEAVAKRSLVRLSWPVTDDPAIVAWIVWRKPDSPDSQRVELGRLKASRGETHLLIDQPGKGGWIYTVAALNAAGSAGPEAMARVICDPARTPRLVLDWPLTDKPAGATVTGNVKFTPEGAVFEGGYLQTPHDTAMDMDLGLTVQFEFRDESTADMPVLISHGLWRGDGWYVQRLGGALVARTSVGDSPSFPIQRGQWHRVRMAYAGLGDMGAGGHPRGYMSLDGQLMTDPDGKPVMAFRLEPEIDKGGIPTPLSLDRPLVVGQYNAPGDNFAFRGGMRNLKIWDDYLENGDQ